MRTKEGRKKMNVLKAVFTYKIIAIARGVPPEKIVSVAKALHKGGIRFLEVTFDQKDENTIVKTCGMIKALCENVKEMYIGAGTVMTEDQAAAAIQAGAKYIISPNVSQKVIKKTLELGVVSIPGAFTPTEIASAYEMGAHIIKVFPAGDLGLGYLKSITAPLSHIPMLATGGVDDTNLSDFLKLGMAGVGIGSNIVNRRLIDAEEYEKLTELAQKYTSQI